MNMQLPVERVGETELIVDRMCTGGCVLKTKEGEIQHFPASASQKHGF